MTTTQELFRFVTLRRPERLKMFQVNTRMVRDYREADPASLLTELMGPGLFETKLSRANTFALSADFVESDDLMIQVLDRVAEFLRETLKPGLTQAELIAAFEEDYPLLAGLLKFMPPQALLESTTVFLARLWDSLYAQVIRGCDRYVTTNYLADALRVYHILRVMWLLRKMNVTVWPGGTFDEYEVLIDLEKAKAGAGDDDYQPGPVGVPWTIDPDRMEQVGDLIGTTLAIDDATSIIDHMVTAGSVQIRPDISETEPLLDGHAIQLLQGHKGLTGIDLETTPVNQVMTTLGKRRQLASTQMMRLQQAPLDIQSQQVAEHALQDVLAQNQVVIKGSPPASPLSALASHFFVPLSVGEIQPPVVGDLLLVEQALQRYEMGEIAEIENVLRGERKERSTRNLSRTSQTTTTEQSSEREETESLKTDERFQLSSQAQQAASQTFSFDAGVNVSGKFGPVQVSASANASFSTSKSSSESTSQEFAKTVTEEATKRVRESIKQTSSVTLLTEIQNTSLHGVNNEGGADHIIGIYRWLNKIYTARTMNYGRRVMFRLEVPEPAAFFRSLMNQNEAELLDGLTEPVHPSKLDHIQVRPIEEGSAAVGVLSYKQIDQNNYGAVAAYYDVTDITPPPPNQITGAKAIVFPDADQAEKMENRTDANELSLVMADNTLTVDPNYKVDKIGVYATTGDTGKLQWYRRSLKLGMNKNEDNMLLVEVGDQPFYFQTTGNGNNDPADISTNFNTWQYMLPDEGKSPAALEGTLQTPLPISVSADFEGRFNFNVVYTASLRWEALDTWKQQTYEAILKGYLRKKQEYDQALEIAKSKVQAETESKTYLLRDEQYRSIESTELKRACIELLTKNTAVGHTSIVVGDDGSVQIIHDEAEGSLIENWRSPLANGSVIQFFETAFAWGQMTYEFHPYFWTDSVRWKELMQASSADPIFEQFLKAGAGSVVVPVEPGYERSVVFFFKTGLIWGGGYLPLFTEPDMLEVYADVEQAVQLDPPEQVGESWELTVPTNLVMLQADSELPEFEIPWEDEVPAEIEVEEPALDGNAPF